MSRRHAFLVIASQTGYEGVSVRTLNRELGVSHSLLNARFGSKQDLWYATVDWAFEPLATKIKTASDPTLTDPLDLLRLTIAAPFTPPLARRFDPADPRDPEAVARHADLVADLIVRGLQRDQA